MSKASKQDCLLNWMVFRHQCIASIPLLARTLPTSNLSITFFPTFDPQPCPHATKIQPDPGYHAIKSRAIIALSPLSLTLLKRYLHLMNLPPSKTNPLPASSPHKKPPSHPTNKPTSPPETAAYPAEAAGTPQAAADSSAHPEAEMAGN